MRLASIASGSSGNCIYAGSERSHILIDDGIAGKRVTEGLKALELAPEDLTGILITHEHADHVKGLGVYLRKYNIPVYATAPTIERILADSRLGRMPEELFHPIQKDEDFELGDLTIHAFAVPHDAADPVAYRVECGDKKAAVVTDLGEYDERIIAELQDLDVALVEANHDIRMLETGPYPYMLKQRILGRLGHICNESAGGLLSGILHDGMKHILLGHLSKENNYPALALEAVRMEISLRDTPYSGGDFDIDVAPRDHISRCIAW